MPWKHENVQKIFHLQLNRTILSILADLSAAVWMVLFPSRISNFSSLLSKPLGTVPSSPTIIGNTVNLEVYSFLSIAMYCIKISFFPSMYTPSC